MKSLEHRQFISLIVITLAVLFLQPGCKGKVEEPWKAESKKAEFVDRQVCFECHEEQYRQWTGSHHDLAMDVATDETVIGNFDNSTFTHFGVTSSFYKRDGKFYIRTDGADGKLHEYEITYVFGVDPLQQYMIEFPDGRIQLPDIGWDDHPKEEGGQRWFHLHPDEKINPKHIFHWTRRFLNWNYMCGECHTTNFQKNYDLETNTFKTTWSEIDVGCQACHGPGSNHVEWARAFDKTESREYTFDETGLEVNFKADDSRVQIEACARCHSRRNGLQKDYQYGKPFMDYYVPQVLTDPLYYPDGQILDEVYVYGSFLQSKKYQQGVRCTDCHNPHTARLHVSGNELCNGCHASSPSHHLDSVALKDYDTHDHHFHEQGSEGARCVECHMPETNYMIVDPRRDHKFQLPRPDLSVKLNIPNPCNRCHKDRSFQWAAEKVSEWYPLTKEKREKETSVAEIFAAGQADKPEAVKALIEVAGDGSQPGIIRATALNILSRFRMEDAIDATASSLKDSDPLVRYEAVRGISTLLPRQMGLEAQKKKASLLLPLLKDSTRAVRSETARALTEVPPDLIGQTMRPDFERALQEYKERQESIADRPEAHLNLGLLYESLGQDDMAEVSYKTALRLVPDFVPVMFNLANLYNRTGRNREAEQQLRNIIETERDNGDAYYSLGLLLAEENRLDEAVRMFAKAVELMPDRARVRYNYALTLRHLGKNADALDAMIKAHETDKTDPGIVQAIAIFYIQDHQWAKALPFAELLVELVPDAEGPQQMLKQIQQAVKSGGKEKASDDL